METVGSHLVEVAWTVVGGLIALIGSTAAWTVKKVVEIDKYIDAHKALHAEYKEDIQDLKNGQERTRRAVEDLTLVVSAHLRS
jgi:hypothetical protein